MLINDIHLTNINSPVRQVKAKVGLYKGSTLVNTFAYTDSLKSFSVERVGEGKFFGFGICHKINIHLIDSNRQLNITTENSFKVYFGAGTDYINVFPTFYVTEVHRDENTNELSITAYDALYKAVEHTYSELSVPAVAITPYDVAILCRHILGLAGCNHNGGNGWDVSYPTGPNYEGTETLREVLDDVAEATQSVYYIAQNNVLYFKKLDKLGNAVLTIDKSKYITLDSGTNRRLTKIVHATELGDNVSASLAITGSTQYVRDNAFWDMRSDIDTLVTNALGAVNGLTINQFNCEWRGNYLLEPGDAISFVTKDNSTVTSYLLNDTIIYDGSLSETTEWQFADDSTETAENSASLGDALKQTFAKVDKVNKEITLMASDVQANSAEISSLMMNVDSINASVQETEKTVNETFNNMGDEIAELTKRVDATMTSEDITFLIQQEISVINPEVDKVITSTGFRFDAEGLTVSKSDSVMTTQITEDGLTVYRDGEEALVADNEGVKAANLHATTYLIVGTYSRFEDYGDRTCCFWIG
jgi:uncharacterized protein YoxC